MSLPNDFETTSDQRHDAIDAFFRRNGFTSFMRQRCDDFAQLRFREVKRTVAPHQGYCSYTLALSDSHLLQFRPEAFKLDLRICQQAKTMFPDLVPSVVYLAALSDGLDGGVLHAYLLERSGGITLTQFRMRQKTSDSETIRTSRRRLVQDLAHIFATSYLHRRHRDLDQSKDGKGNIGRSLRYRLDILEGLPSLYKNYVRAIQRRIGSLEQDGPWCLTHGDLVPDNIMVNPDTGHLTGLIDWAEGEWLPFGVGLYGLEEVFGEDRSDHKGFKFHPEHNDLRKLFWKTFIRDTRPASAILSTSWMADLELGRHFGILLWRGIAFDDGKLNRVVEEDKDAEEFHKLGLFLQAPGPTESLGRWRAEILASLLRQVFESCLPRKKDHDNEDSGVALRRGLESVSSTASDKSRGESWREVGSG